MWPLSTCIHWSPFEKVYQGEICWFQKIQQLHLCWVWGWFPPIWKLSVKLDHVPLKAPPTNPSKLALFWKIWKGRQVDSGQIRIFHQPTFPFSILPPLPPSLKSASHGPNEKVKQTQEAFLATPQCASEWHPEIGTTPCSTKNWSTICKRSVWIRIRTHRNLQL